VFGFILYGWLYIGERSHTVAHRVGTKGQVVIEKAIRDALGVKPGWLAIQQVVDGHLEIHFFPPEHSESLLGILAPYSDMRIPDEDALHDATERARGEQAAEVVARMRETASE
jgi:bifunctional DNA-binding transcriptional regulator/antitoxin component of YhaV-PrlF toxin-antitoxin module